jgi:4-hydroxybenzoate polyprenyltransferase
MPAARLARTRRWLAALPWLLWALAMLGLAAVPWFDHLLREAGRSELAQLNASGVPAVLGVVSAATVGAVLASRRPRHPVGWLLLGLGLSVSASGAADGYAPYGLLVQPGHCRRPASWRCTALFCSRSRSPALASSCC